MLIETDIQKVFALHNFQRIPQVQTYLSNEEKHTIEVIGNVLPFKVNNYVIDELIDWENLENDPIYKLTFPQKGMLSEKHFSTMESALKRNLSKTDIKLIANSIRLELNPHPAGQMEYNVPKINGISLTGLQHKYEQTVLFFPKQSQTCHSYCTFCFRWPQFVGIDELKFGMYETELLVNYLKQHTEITDILFTGGDPMIMSAKRLQSYIDPILENDIPHLQTIRIGTKSLTYWPYRYLTDKDSDDILRLFEKIVKSGYHLAFMAHINHGNEIRTEAAEKAIKRILNTGAVIRTQAPILNHLNNTPEVWSEMWKKQVKLGCVPYYMFIPRDTGSHDYFSVTLEESWKIFREAYKQVSGIARTVRGPIMSAHPGKIHILGVSKVNGEKVFALRFIQGRNSDWVGKPFFAKYDSNVDWIDGLVPAFGEDKFFFEDELSRMNY
jgi:KamA family protein